MNSNSVSDYVNAQARQTTIQNNLQKSIDKVNELKQQLANKKAQVQTLLNSQQDQKKTLIASQAEQQSLENANTAQQADFNSKVSANNGQIAQIRQAQQDYWSSQGGDKTPGGSYSGVIGLLDYKNYTGSLGLGGGYPYTEDQDSTTDPWGMYNRECVSYAAWRISTGYGKTVPNMGGVGMAFQWPQYAPSRGGSIVSDPRPGDMVIAPNVGPYLGKPYYHVTGHAMVVEPSTPSTPSGWIHVTQYNFDGHGHYSDMDINPNKGVVFIRFY